MSGVGLEIALHKSEMILVSNLQPVQVASIKIGSHVVRAQEAIKYLGVMIDSKLSFKNHVEYASSKAKKALHALSGMMGRTKGLSSSKRRLLAGVVSSVLRYAGPAWAEALTVQRNLDSLNQVHRLTAVRVAGSFSTVSLAAVCVITGMIPVGIRVEEDMECYAGRGRARTRGAGRWSAGSVRGRASSEMCPACAGVVESPEHVVFRCPRFDEARSRTRAIIGEEIRPENIVSLMCGNREAFDGNIQLFITLRYMYPRPYARFYSAGL
ncbi:uncharacterized protein LOC126576580 [Anopheles aquasalis]|uniref:uncharacterized protein LOC126576580 n=1 Tax=Anopheles aquasalis TaxID=42839 RepID=UPI00215B41D7|nr:uncharacterized protein LOC126576580 [Anopheles aquasalis]